jgi:DNA repair protein RecO (recombination protein O)
MGLVETEALILRTYALSDADKIVVALTEDEGLVRGVAKGAKRLKSRFGSGLEPFSIVRLSYYQKEEKELVSVSAIELEHSYFAIASDPNFLKAFSYAAELLVAFAPPHEKNERLYRMTKFCLEAAAEKGNFGAVLLYFEIWLLKLGGFLPSWEKCVSCGREPSENETVSLEPDFSVACGDCVGRGKLINVTSFQRSLFTYAQKTSPMKFVEIAKGDPGEVETVSLILRRMIARILNREVGSAGAPAGP